MEGGSHLNTTDSTDLTGSLLLEELKMLPWTQILLAISMLVVSYSLYLIKQQNEKINKLQQKIKQRDVTKKRAVTYPQHFPASWYRLASSHDIKIGQVQSVEALGEVFAVFRGEDGKIGVLDAYCPHLGANLAVGGRVNGNCLECPFHQWEFDACGTCANIPYSSGNIPSAAKTFAWPSVEKFGSIFVYYSPDRQPTAPYEIPDLIGPNYVCKGEVGPMEVGMHLQEFSENAGDFQHFQPVHGRLYVPFTSIPIPILKVHHRIDWKRSDETGDAFFKVPSELPTGKHVSFLQDDAYLSIFGRNFPKLGLKGIATFFGPGAIVFFYFDTPYGKIIVQHTHLPMTLTDLNVNFRWFVEPSVPSLLVWYLIGSLVSQWQQDIVLWQNKIFIPRPVLVKGDGPVMRVRQWYSQFYPQKTVQKNVPSTSDSPLSSSGNVTLHSTALDW